MYEKRLFALAVIVGKAVRSCASMGRSPRFWNIFEKGRFFPDFKKDIKIPYDSKISANPIFAKPAFFQS